MSDQACKTYLLGGLRTPFGRFGGSLSAERPIDLCLSPAKASPRSLGSADRVRVRCRAGQPFGGKGSWPWLCLYWMRPFWPWTTSSVC